MATESPAPSATTIEDTLGSLDTIIDLVERQLSEARELIARREPELERYREARALLSGDGDEPPPSSPPELKPDSDDDPPPAQHQPSQAPAEASSTSSSPEPPALPSRGSGGSSKARGERNRATVLAAAKAACAAGGGSARGVDIYERCPDLTRSCATTTLTRLVNDGSVQRHGRSKAIRYTIPSTTTPATPPAARRAPRPMTGGDSSGRGAKQEPRLEGRILSWLQLNSGSTAAQIVAAMGNPAVLPELGKLMADGDIRSQRKAGEIVYVAAAA